MYQILAMMRRRVSRTFMTRDQRRAELVGPPDLWDMKRRFQTSFVRGAGLKPRHYFVSIGCGVLRGGIPNINYLNTGHFYGIDARKHALNEARRELKEAGLEQKRPQLIHAEHLASLSLDRQFDFAWAFSVLIHMADPVLDETMQFVARHLKPDGVFYANVDTANKPDGIWQEFPHVYRPVSFYQEACDRHGLTLTDLGPLSALGHISGDPSDHHRMLKIEHKQ